jgi:hypothetical protein
LAQNANNGFRFDFLERYNKDGGKFLYHIVLVTANETWILVMNVETKSSQSSGCTHIHETS